MSDNVIQFRREGDRCFTVDDMRQAICEADLDRVFAIGFTTDNRLFVECTCNFEAAALVLALERFKHALLGRLEEDD